MLFQKDLTQRQVLIAEGLLILVFCALPLLLQLPYRVNIFLTWEGAYRMYLGQVPFRDFGLPLCYGFWVIPFIFFKVFGPYMFSLLLAQAFINLLSLLAFRSILRSFNLSAVATFLSLVVFCLTFVIVNFWPWYNHTVFVFELIGLATVVRHILIKRSVLTIIVSAFFAALSFFTKQDGGGLALVLVGALLLIDFLYERKFKTILLFAGAYVVTLAILIGPLLQYDFGYWFNHGQPPHFSRINALDFLTSFFEESIWIKFYAIVIVVAAVMRLNSREAIKESKTFVLYAALTLGILVQAAIIQVTSFSPATTSHYYHAFGFAFLLFAIAPAVELQRAWIAVMFLALIFIWRSENYWKYTQRIFASVIPSVLAPPPANVVSKHTWAADENAVKDEPVNWVSSQFRTLRRIKLPEGTEKGLQRIKTLEQVAKPSPRVLNMSNLSFLAYELGYAPEAGQDFPLWYHRGVAFFDREVNTLCDRVAEGQYDLILFEDMPDVDNFFPYAVRDCALENGYVLEDKFIAPTGYKTDSVEVYVRKRAESGLN